ncbi:hypothetical protein ACWGCC_40040, partial [Streptomyces nigrescens]
MTGPLRCSVLRRFLRGRQVVGALSVPEEVAVPSDGVPPEGVVPEVPLAEGLPADGPEADCEGLWVLG